MLFFIKFISQQTESASPLSQMHDSVHTVLYDNQAVMTPMTQLQKIVIQRHNTLHNNVCQSVQIPSRLQTVINH